MLPAVRAEKVAAGGFWVLRPDSGDPTDAVLAALIAADRTFGKQHLQCLTAGSQRALEGPLLDFEEGSRSTGRRVGLRLAGGAPY